MPKPATSDTTIDVNIDVERSTLSDGSHVFDIVINGLRIPCITEGDAQRCADAIVDAIHKHSNECAATRFNY